MMCDALASLSIPTAPLLLYHLTVVPPQQPLIAGTFQDVPVCGKPPPPMVPVAPLAACPEISPAPAEDAWDPPPGSLKAEAAGRG